jgi:hypothetical protein
MPQGAGAVQIPWYVPAALGGHRTHAPRSRLRAATIGALATALAISIAACGGESSSGPEEEAGTYQVEIARAEFPTLQRLGQTSLMRLDIRNVGRKAVPALTVTVNIAGKEGEGASIPFAIRDPQPGLAQPDRPVWVLSAKYPRLAGSSEPAGATTSGVKTFDFGRLEAGATVAAIWKLNAVKTGKYDLLYDVDAGLGGQAKAETAAGTKPGGSFAVRITEAQPDTIVTDSGEVVEIDKQKDSGR